MKTVLYVTGSEAVPVGAVGRRTWNEGDEAGSGATSKVEAMEETLLMVRDLL